MPRDHSAGRPQLSTAHRSSLLRELRSRLASVSIHLGRDELRVLVLVGERLRAGRRVYGDLSLATDTRDFAREALEEAADMAVYAAAELIRMRQRIRHRFQVPRRRKAEP